jgi:hypothetical protein
VLEPSILIRDGDGAVPDEDAVSAGVAPPPQAVVIASNARPPAAMRALNEWGRGWSKVMA